MPETASATAAQRRPRTRTRPWPRLRALVGADTPGDVVFKATTGLLAAAVAGVFLLVLALLARGAWPALSEFGLGFLWSQDWSPPEQGFGALPYLAGTLASAALALAMAVPVAIGTAVALVHLLPRAIAAPLGLLVELLAAVPSIVFGVWGLAFVAPKVADLSGGRSFGPSLLAAALVLAVMVLPIITAITRDMVLAVPRAQSDAALALGATRWEVTWRIVLPYARPGIVAAVILGFARAIGETMAVIMVIGNQPLLPGSVFDPASTLASVIANEFGDPSGPLHASALVALGLVMLALSLAMTLAARAVAKRLGRSGAGGAGAA